MGRTDSQRLQAQRRELEDQVVVYALTSRRPPESLVAAHRQAYMAAQAAGLGPLGPPPKGGLVSRLLGA